METARSIASVNGQNTLETKRNRTQSNCSPYLHNITHISEYAKHMNLNAPEVDTHEGVEVQCATVHFW